MLARLDALFPVQIAVENTPQFTVNQPWNVTLTNYNLQPKAIFFWHKAKIAPLWGILCNLAALTVRGGVDEQCMMDCEENRIFNCLLQFKLLVSIIYEVFDILLQQCKWKLSNFLLFLFLWLKVAWLVSSGFALELMYVQNKVCWRGPHVLTRIRISDSFDHGWPHEENFPFDYWSYG